MDEETTLSEQHAGDPPLVDGSRYRVIVNATLDEQGVVYVARAPELPNCQARGATRAEALAQLEATLDEQLISMRREGVQPPQPVDLQPFDGKLSVKVSTDLHRELAFAAQVADIEFGSLLAELLARAVGGPTRSGPPRRGPAGGRRRGSMDDKRYHGIMENRADFIEYVRQLERDGGARGGSGGRGRGGRGRR